MNHWRGTGRSWSDQEDDWLRSLYGDGVGPTAVGMLLGGRSRNSVVGRAHRLGMTSHRTISRAEQLASIMAEGFPLPAAAEAIGMGRADAVLAWGVICAGLGEVP